MPLDWSPFVEFVRRRRHFLLMTHVRPDGDGLGSQLALADALRGLGKTARVLIASKLPSRYDFLNPAGEVERFDAAGDYADADAVVVLDTGTWNQLGEFGPYMQGLACGKAVIDHHATQDDLGGIALVDTSAEATGRLVYEARAALGVPLNAHAAHALFVALAMDTGWFRHPNTRPETFAMAEDLVRAGAKPERIYEALFEQNTLERYRLMGLVLERLRLAGGGRVAYSEVHLADYEATGARPQDTEDLIAYPRSIAGVDVGLLFIEQPGGGVKVSFRSRELNVGRVAESFGGGGHRLASGATLTGGLPDARDRVLAAVLAGLE